MKKRIIGLALIACMLFSMLVVFTGCGQEKSPFDPDHPITITIWHYYTNEQEKAFNAQVEEFNNTRGKELGIIVRASSEGNVGNLEDSVISAAKQEVGAKDIPNIFAAYSDTAYKIDQMGLVADIGEYFTEEEKAEYIDGYLKEGDLDGNGSLKIFPIAKATEIFVLNLTDWQKFADATGAQLDDLNTIEGLTETAAEYYEWSNGKALFGRDAMANYLLIGAKQLGVDIISVDENGKASLNFPKETLRKLWDNYYIPYIKGHFSSSGKYRSDDVQIGNIVGFVGSSTSESFFPSHVLLDDDMSYPIEHVVLEAPKFADGLDYAIQQGAGLVVTQRPNDESSKIEVMASVEFLKWFTESTQNIKFSDSSDYLPVKKAANDIEVIKTVLGEDFKSSAALEISLNTVNSNELYTPPATEHGAEARSVLENCMSDKAKADRAAIEQKIKDGMSYDDAVAEYTTDANFEAWYNETKTALEGYFTD